MLLGVNSGTISIYCMSFQRPPIRGLACISLLSHPCQELATIPIGTTGYGKNCQSSQFWHNLLTLGKSIIRPHLLGYPLGFLLSCHQLFSSRSQIGRALEPGKSLCHSYNPWSALTFSRSSRSCFLSPFWRSFSQEAVIPSMHWPLRTFDAAFSLSNARAWSSSIEKERHFPPYHLQDHRLPYSVSQFELFLW